jgi:hypothetical protein
MSVYQVGVPSKCMELSCMGRISFAGDTPVLMADVSSGPIVEAEVGDEVRNPEPDDGSLGIMS